MWRCFHFQPTDTTAEADSGTQANTAGAATFEHLIIHHGTVMLPNSLQGPATPNTLAASWL